MKKRVNNSEIELARKSSKVLFLISFILLILLFFGFGILYFMDVDLKTYFQLPKKVEKEIVVESDIIADDSDVVEVNIQDSNIQRLFKYVKVTNEGICEDGGYTNKDKAYVKDMSEKCKFSLASNIYREKVQQGLDGKLFVLESDVKDAYEYLFGAGTYEVQDSIPCLYKTNFMYGGSYYFTESVASLDGSSMSSYEKIISATRNKEKLDITSAVLYYEHVLSLFCKDINCENIVEKAKPGVEYGDEYFDLYVEHNQKSLHHYVYHFEMDNNGFYHYVGYDRTNE